MTQISRVSKRKHRNKALPVLSVAGLSVALASAAADSSWPPHSAHRSRRARASSVNPTFGLNLARVRKRFALAFVI
jgi:hypothetical protein